MRLGWNFERKSVGDNFSRLTKIALYLRDVVDGQSNVSCTVYSAVPDLHELVMNPKAEMWQMVSECAGTYVCNSGKECRNEDKMQVYCHELCDTDFEFMVYESQFYEWCREVNDNPDLDTIVDIDYWRGLLRQWKAVGRKQIDPELVEGLSKAVELLEKLGAKLPTVEVSDSSVLETNKTVLSTPSQPSHHQRPYQRGKKGVSKDVYNSTAQTVSASYGEITGSTFSESGSHATSQIPRRKHVRMEVPSVLCNQKELKLAETKRDRQNFVRLMRNLLGSIRDRQWLRRIRARLFFEDTPQLNVSLPGGSEAAQRLYLIAAFATSLEIMKEVLDSHANPQQPVRSTWKPQDIIRNKIGIHGLEPYFKQLELLVTFYKGMKPVEQLVGELENLPDFRNLWKSAEALEGVADFNPLLDSIRQICLKHVQKHSNGGHWPLDLRYISIFGDQLNHETGNFSTLPRLRPPQPKRAKPKRSTSLRTNLGTPQPLKPSPFPKDFFRFPEWMALADFIDFACKACRTEAQNLKMTTQFWRSVFAGAEIPSEGETQTESVFNVSDTVLYRESVTELMRLNEDNLTNLLCSQQSIPMQTQEATNRSQNSMLPSLHTS